MYPTRTRLKKHTDFPVFPPQNIVLHPDDATSKVFMAVARAFISVDNRAMTIKDIAERACHYGLVCQNLSAAAQAVTTYLRQHKARCDQQDDHPLLLSHILSGTPADDDLVPALFSRSGGDSHSVSNNRLTNFRKGTAVWYLSRATGIPCPFARAGIRLCDYLSVESPSLFPEEHKISSRRLKLLALSTQQDDTLCGQKRKRPLRAFSSKERDSSDVEQRPQKVKLTLRLKPLIPKSNPPPLSESSASISIDISRDSPDDDSHPADSSSSSSSSSSDDEDVCSPQSQPSTQRNQVEAEEPWSLPPYPRHSISIPCYTPSVESSYYSTYDLPPSKYRDPFRRSPSVPFSIASPPPESEDELDTHHALKMMRHESGDDEEDDDLGWEADLDGEGEVDNVFEGPGSRSLVVKEEPRDVQGMLDAWEGFDSIVAERCKAEEDYRSIKVELPEPWDSNHLWTSEDIIGIKQEDFGLFDPLWGPSASPLSPISSLSSQFSSFSWSDASSPPHETMTDNQEEAQQSYATIRPRARTAPTLFARPSYTSSKSNSPFTPPPPPPLAQTVRHSVSSGSSSSSVAPPTSAPLASSVLVTLLQSMSVNGTYPISTAITSAPQPCVSPLQTRCVPSPTTGVPPAEKVVVHTCQPCHPAITATHMEDIPVFQMMLGPFQLLRRIDSDFVNLSPIIAYSGTAGIPTTASDREFVDHDCPPTSPRPPPLTSNLVTNATVITSGSPEVCGTWVTLAAAQAYVRDHLSSGQNEIARRALVLFLSDRLVEKFPSALQDFHRLNASLRALNQFGKHFESTLMVAGGGGVGVLDCAVKFSGGRSDDEERERDKDLEAKRGFTDGLVQPDDDGRDAPLSKTEQDLFHELCDFPPDCEGGAEMMVVDEHSVTMDSANSGTSSISPKSPVPISVPAKRSLHGKKGSMSSISSLSSDSDTLARSTSTVVPVVKSKLASISGGKRSDVMSEMGDDETNNQANANKPLRRSKRVADMVAAQPYQLTSGGGRAIRGNRKGRSNSRTSLS